MAKPRYTTRNIRRKPVKVAKKRWQIFETVYRNKKGHIRRYDRARITMPGRNARRRTPTGSGYEYIRSGDYDFGVKTRQVASSGGMGKPWRPKLHPRDARGRFTTK